MENQRRQNTFGGETTPDGVTCPHCQAGLAGKGLARLVVLAQTPPFTVIFVY